MQAQMERRMLLLFAQTALEKLRQRSAVNAVNYADYQRRFFGRPDVAGSRHDTFAAMRARVAALAQPEPDAPILDACAGAGWQARAFARSGHRRIVAIDLVVERLVGARRVEPGEPIAFCAMDAARLGFADGSFACASLTLGLHDMPYEVRRRVLRELARVTRGRVVIAEPSAPRHPLQRPGRARRRGRPAGRAPGARPARHRRPARPRAAISVGPRRPVGGSGGAGAARPAPSVSRSDH
jgi:SAM-dependent methyltransferase